MLCWKCGKSVGSAAWGPARWVKAFGVSGKVPACQKCAGELAARFDSGIVALAHRSPKGMYGHCPGCQTIVWFRMQPAGIVLPEELRGQCRGCGAVICGIERPMGEESEPDELTRPKPEDSPSKKVAIAVERAKQRLADLVEGQLRVTENSVEPVPAMTQEHPGSYTTDTSTYSVSSP